jgi:hypothetical protein
MISFRWDRPTSVLMAAILVGTLVDVGDDALLVRVADGESGNAQEDLIAFLLKSGKITPAGREGDVWVSRGVIEDVRPYPPE